MWAQVFLVHEPDVTVFLVQEVFLAEEPEVRLAAFRPFRASKLKSGTFSCAPGVGGHGLCLTFWKDFRTDHDFEMKRGLRVQLKGLRPRRGIVD